MLDLAVGLDRRRLEAIAGLEQRVTDADGGRLKLEWDALRTRPGERVEDLLWWQDGQLLGYCGSYGHGTSVEIAGMVDPAARRAGIGTSLATAALGLCAERGADHVLLVVPGAVLAGHLFASGLGGVLEHSEHALQLTGSPVVCDEDPRTRLRPAEACDTRALAALLEAAFGHPVTDLARRLSAPGRRTLMIEREGAVVGTIAHVISAEGADIYGFAVDPAWQGRGIGRDVLGRTCRLLRAAGARRIGLEVAVGNDRALALYTSLGFAAVTREDYYRVPTTQRRG